MRKPLLFLGTLILSTAATASTTACNEPNLSKYNLKDHLVVTNLGTIPEEIPGTIPNDREIKTQLYNLNHSLDINHIIIKDRSDHSALVIGDGIFYNNDKIAVSYEETKIDISTIIIDNQDIGNFETDKQSPSSDAIKERLHQKYPQLDINHLLIENISKEKAVVKGDEKLYTKQVWITFSVDSAINLATIIKKDLSVETKGKSMATKEDIITALHDTYQEKLNINAIAIHDVPSATSVTISSTNEKIYRGEVIVNLHLDISVALKDVINNGLSKVAISNKTITENDVTKQLAKQYPTLKMNAIDVNLQSSNSVIIKSINKNIYTGDNLIINNLLIDLSSVVSNQLPTFHIPGQSQPNQTQLLTALQANNTNLSVDKIKIDKITDSSVTISGDGKFYSKDKVIINYDCDKLQFLSDVFHNLNLGTINTNGLLVPTVTAVTNAISTANPNLQMNALRFTKSDITDKTVVVSGDNISYKGSVVAHFAVENSNINIQELSYSHSETNAVGELKTTWTSPDITILANWTDYASDWSSFTKKFTKLSFGDKSYFSVYCNTYTDQKLSASELSINTSDISGDRNKNTLQLNYYYDGGIWGAFLQLDGYIHIWHDEANVYVSCNWSIDTVKCFRDRVWSINLQGANFS